VAGAIKGRLLVALPVLRDPNFDRTVVYMLEHSAEGAVGVVLNRPSPLTVAEPLDEWAALAAEPEVIFVGGPVGPSDAIGLGEGVSGLSTIDLEEGPDALVEPIDRVRVFAGYAGWGAGQLEDEIGAGAWLIVDTLPGDVMTDDPEQLWSDVLRRQGGRLAAVARFPRDTTLN
jgi:putative transcriptional regulator